MAVNELTGNAYIKALELADGSELWSSPLSSAARLSSPTFDDGAIYFQRNDGIGVTEAWAMHSGTGATKWTTPHGAQWDDYYAPCVADGSVWVNGGQFGGMYRFNTSNGAERFFVDLPQADQWAPGYHQGKLYS